MLFYASKIISLFLEYFSAYSNANWTSVRVVTAITTEDGISLNGCE